MEISCFASMHMCTHLHELEHLSEGLSLVVLAWHVTNHGCPAKVCGCPCATEEAENNMGVNSRPTTRRLLSSHLVPGAQCHTPLPSMGHNYHSTSIAVMEMGPTSAHVHNRWWRLTRRAHPSGAAEHACDS